MVTQIPTALRFMAWRGGSHYGPANSALKLTVRPRISRRPSRLPRLEFARRRATCTGIIGCAASGAPLDAGRPPAARNLTSRRWDDTESHVASSSPVRIVLLPLNGTLRSLFESRVHL